MGWCGGWLTGEGDAPAAVVQRLPLILAAGVRQYRPALHHKRRVDLVPKLPNSRLVSIIEIVPDGFSWARLTSGPTWSPELNFLSAMVAGWPPSEMEAEHHSASPPQNSRHRSKTWPGFRPSAQSEQPGRENRSEHSGARKRERGGGAAAAGQSVLRYS